MSPPIFILTDFGTADPFVGIMKAVISQISPNTQIIDLTHEVPPGDIRLGAVLLWQSLPYLPKGSVILSVIDPGVGTTRRPILLQTGGLTFIGPDNGTFSFILKADYRVWELQNPDLALPQTGATFHGRDIFAPAAAYVASGVPASSFGPPLMDLALIPPPVLSCSDRNVMEGEIIHIDRFGNALTSIGQFLPLEQRTYNFHPWIGECRQVKVNLHQAQVQLPDQVKLNWAANFAEIPVSACRFILGSSGLIEIAANRQRAANLLNLALEDPVTLVAYESKSDRRNL